MLGGHSDFAAREPKHNRAPITNDLRDFVQDLEKYEAMQIFLV